MEPAVGSEDAEVFEVTVNFYLAPDVHLCLLAADFLLFQDLERADKAGFGMFGEVHLAELSLAKGLPDLRHAKM